MILVTVGSMFPFERLVEAMDGWARENPAEEVVSQIGDGRYIPRNCRWHRMIAPAEFSRLCREADVIVAHAGMGTIFTVLESGRPLVIMPRLAALREHTSDHQVATAERFGGQSGITVVKDEHALRHVLDGKRFQSPQKAFSLSASPDLINRVRSFILSA